MRVLPFDSRLEPLFWEHVYLDIPHHYFFILDMKHDRPSTKILLTLDENDRIEGMMLIYRERIVQLRGSAEAAEALLARLDIQQAEIQGLETHRAPILSKFGKVNRTTDLLLMRLRSGEATLRVGHPVEQLSAADAEDIAALMRHGDPELWSEVSAQRIAERMADRLWLGIKINCRLVSIGGAIVDDWGSNISTVVTQKAYRSKGYAPCVVSALVEQILRQTSLVLIHVERDNAPAVRAYTKVGFKPYRRYFVARAESPERSLTS
jgi:ribosomal protein S18 acetylase RimI-like enzyme